MPSVGFEPIISAGERPKTYALDRAATGTVNATQTVLIYDVRNKSRLNNINRVHKSAFYLNDKFCFVSGKAKAQTVTAF